MLGLDFAGDLGGQYGALSVTKLTTLDGGLAIDLADGFKLATGDRFDILGLGSLKGPGFDALALDGATCSSTVADKWTCGGGVRLNEVIAAISLDLVVAHAPAAFGPAGSSPIPEPSTWTMLALGFLALAGSGSRGAGEPRRVSKAEGHRIVRRNGQPKAAVACVFDLLFAMAGKRSVKFSLHQVRTLSLLASITVEWTTS